MIPDSFQKNEYDKNGNLPMAWEMSADGLLIAADVLRNGREQIELSNIPVGSSVPPEVFTLSAELMLRGFAVECILKAVWLSRGNQIVEDGKYKGIPGVNQHNLVELSKAIGLKLSDKVNELLSRLSIYTTSIGRYPIAKSWEITKIRKRIDGTISPPSIWRLPSDYELLENFFQKLKTELHQKSKKPPKQIRLA